MPGAIMNAVRTRGDLDLVALDREVGSASSTPGRRIEMSTVVPFGPLTRLTTSFGRPALRVFRSPTRAMMSPRRMPARYAGDPSKSDVTVIVAVDREDADADAEVAAACRSRICANSLRLEEARVRIERAQHAVDRAVARSRARPSSRLDVLVLDGGQRRGVDAGTRRSARSCVAAGAACRAATPATTESDRPPRRRRNRFVRMSLIVARARRLPASSCRTPRRRRC